MSQQSPDVIKEGWATKVGGFFKTWHKRWFVLTHESISYYSRYPKFLKGSIPIAEVSEVIEFPDCRKGPGLKLVIPQKRVYIIAFDSTEIAGSWVTAIKQLLKPAHPPAKTTLEDFQILAVLGRGGYGKVQLVRHKETGKLYAMKSMQKRQLEEQDLVMRTIAERDVFLSANHPFLVSAKYTFQTATSVFMALEYIPGGELYSRLRKEECFSESQTQLYAAMLVMAIGHLHSIGILHRDLKPENILFDSDGYLRITDYGLVRKFEPGEKQTTKTYCGTPEYLAPEMILGQEYGKAVDWWAIGILTYEMLYGAPPFYDQNASVMYTAIVREELSFPTDPSPEVMDFLTRILDKNPETRLGSGPDDVDEVRQSPFFNGINWDDLYHKRLQMEWKPPITSMLDISQFDEEFTRETPNVTYEDPSVIDGSTQQILEGFSRVNESSVID